MLWWCPKSLVLLCPYIFVTTVSISPSSIENSLSCDIGSLAAFESFLKESFQLREFLEKTCPSSETQLQARPLPHVDSLERKIYVRSKEGKERSGEKPKEDRDLISPDPHRLSTPPCGTCTRWWPCPPSTCPFCRRALSGCRACPC